jgi:hypothetical protein
MNINLGMILSLMFFSMFLIPCGYRGAVIYLESLSFLKYYFSAWGFVLGILSALLAVIFVFMR